MVLQVQVLLQEVMVQICSLEAMEVILDIYSIVAVQCKLEVMMQQLL